MIQRIQTVYLIIAFILSGLLLFFPLATFTDAGHIFYKLTFFHLVKIQNVPTIQSNFYPLAILVFASLISIIAAIFGYKNRSRQMRTCVLSVVLLILTFAAIFYYYMIIKGNLASTVWSVSYISYSPLVAAVFSYLAYKSIKRDDELVKSVDRLR